MSKENYPTYNFQIDLTKLLIKPESPSVVHNTGRPEHSSTPGSRTEGSLSSCLPPSASFSTHPTTMLTSLKDSKITTTSITTFTTTNSPLLFDCVQPIFLYNTLPPSFNNRPTHTHLDKCFLSDEAKQAAANIKDTMAVIAGRRQMFFEQNSPSHPSSHSPSHTSSLKNQFFHPSSAPAKSSMSFPFANSTVAVPTTATTSNFTTITTTKSTTTNNTTTTKSTTKNITTTMTTPSTLKSSSLSSETGNDNKRLKNVDLIRQCPPLEIYTTSPILSPIVSPPSPSLYSPHTSTPTTTQQVIFHFQDGPAHNTHTTQTTHDTHITQTTSTTQTTNVAREETNTQRLEHISLNSEVLSLYQPVSECVPRQELLSCLSNHVQLATTNKDVVTLPHQPLPAQACLVHDESSAVMSVSSLCTSATVIVVDKCKSFFPDSPNALSTDLREGCSHATIATGEEALDADLKKGGSDSKRISVKVEKAKGRKTRPMQNSLPSSIKNSPLSKHNKSPSNKEGKESWKGRVARTIKRYGSSSILLNNEGENKTHKGVFGAPLHALTPSSFDPLVPLIVEVCVKIVEEKGLDNQGLYRVPGNTGALKELQEDIDKDEKGLCVDSDKWHDVNLVTSLLKLFFRKIPDPLITDDLYNAVIESTRVEKSERRMLKLKKLLHELPERNFNTFRYICKHLSLVSRHEENNKMDAHNLAIMFGPTLIRPHDNNLAIMARNMADQCRIVETIISNSEWFFSSWDEDVNVPDDGSGDITAAIDEQMLAKAQNMEQKRNKYFSTLPSFKAPPSSSSSTSSSFSNHHRHHILPYLSLPQPNRLQKVVTFIKKHNNSPTPCTPPSHHILLPSYTTSQTINNSKTTYPTTPNTPTPHPITPCITTPHSITPFITTPHSITPCIMQQSSSDVNLAKKSRGFFGRLGRKTNTKSVESVLNEVAGCRARKEFLSGSPIKLQLSLHTLYKSLEGNSCSNIGNGISKNYASKNGNYKNNTSNSNNTSSNITNKSNNYTNQRSYESSIVLNNKQQYKIHCKLNESTNDVGSSNQAGSIYMASNNDTKNNKNKMENSNKEIKLYKTTLENINKLSSPKSNTANNDTTPTFDDNTKTAATTPTTPLFTIKNTTATITAPTTTHTASQISTQTTTPTITTPTIIHKPATTTMPGDISIVKLPKYHLNKHNTFLLADNRWSP